MRQKKFWFTMSVILAVLAMALMLPAGAGAASKYKVLYKFTGGTDGGNPQAGLVFDPAGNLYGTADGGSSGGGTVFKLTPSSNGKWTESVLYNFCSLPKCADGASPSAGVIFDAAGTLYGTTASAGVNQEGTAFKLTPSEDGSWTESVLYSFCSLMNCTDGAGPQASLALDAAGNLYGTTGASDGHDQCGTVFKLTPNLDGSWAESVLYTFTYGSADYVGPRGLIFDTKGNLYGTTEAGGTNSAGSVFKLTPNSDGSWTESVLHRFTGGTDGANPQAGLVFDATGNLYGTTITGGQHNFLCDTFGCGVVFKLAPSSDGSWTQSVLLSFTGAGDVSQPTSGLNFDAAGNLYGETGYGGCAGPGGAVFQLIPRGDGTWDANLISGCPGGGEYPSGGLAVDAAGNLYGTTFTSSTFCGCGLVFKLTPNGHGGWSSKAIHEFSGPDGNQPRTGVISDAAGHLYGTTSGGSGLVFELGRKDGGWVERVIHRFASHPAASPFAGLIFDASGNLYGTTLFGGPVNGGAVFKLTHNSNGSWAYSVLHVFKDNPAGSPYGGLVLDKAGNLYGTTRGCGSGKCQGAVYEITP